MVGGLGIGASIEVAVGLRVVVNPFVLFDRLV